MPPPNRGGISGDSGRSLDEVTKPQGLACFSGKPLLFFVQCITLAPLSLRVNPVLLKGVLCGSTCRDFQALGADAAVVWRSVLHSNGAFQVRARSPGPVCRCADRVASRGSDDLPTHPAGWSFSPREGRFGVWQPRAATAQAGPRLLPRIHRQDPRRERSRRPSHCVWWRNAGQTAGLLLHR